MIEATVVLRILLQVLVMAQPERAAFSPAAFGAFVFAISFAVLCGVTRWWAHGRKGPFSHSQCS